MRKPRAISDYTFYNSWILKEIGIQPNEAFSVTQDIGDLRTGEQVVFVGYDDVDNHYGIFVFTNARNEILEVTGDFLSLTGTRLNSLKNALEKRET